jgi:hypothetical protein
MSFFNFFKKSKPAPHLEPILFFHEDDYCQVEISPKENLSFFEQQCLNIYDTVKESPDGGFTGIYVREEPVIKLADKKISCDQLEGIIKEMGLEKAGTVLTGYGTNYREKFAETTGYGLNYSAIYFDYTDGIVGHIWLTNFFRLDKEKLSTCLHQLGRTWDLVLFDWNQRVAVNLSDEGAVKKYLNE